jgi:hypothetical protein
MRIKAAEDTQFGLRHIEPTAVEGRLATAGRAGRRRGCARRGTSKFRAARPEPAWCPGDPRGTVYVPFGASSWVSLSEPRRQSSWATRGRGGGILGAWLLI